jgi:hypothetical protein
MSPQTKEKHKQKEDKIHQLDETSQSILHRLIKSDNKSSGNVKLKDELVDLETLFVQERERKDKTGFGVH